MFDNEERIIQYEDTSQVDEIVSTLALEDFLLVEHKSRTKQLHFKKILDKPETKITEE